MVQMNPLSGKPLRYLIGADEVPWVVPGCLTMMPYDHPPIRGGLCAGYCNLFDEHNTGKYGPYLYTSDTAHDYDEGQIDPKGRGWVGNLRDQFKLRSRQGFEYIELDNADAYDIAAVIGAIEFAGNEYGLKVLAKNPQLMDGSEACAAYLRHPNVYGAIVERDAGGPQMMDHWRVTVGKPDMPVWFVSFGRAGKSWAQDLAPRAERYKFMGVTWSKRGEYGSSVDILRPRT